MSQFHSKTPVLGLFLTQCAGLKETPTQLFSWKYCEIFNNTYFEDLLIFNITGKNISEN